MNGFLCNLDVSRGCGHAEERLLVRRFHETRSILARDVVLRDGVASETNQREDNYYLLLNHINNAAAVCAKNQ